MKLLALQQFSVALQYFQSWGGKSPNTNQPIRFLFYSENWEGKGCFCTLPDAAGASRVVLLPLQWKHTALARRTPQVWSAGGLIWLLISHQEESCGSRTEPWSCPWQYPVLASATLPVVPGWSACMAQLSLYKQWHSCPARCTIV